MKSVIFERVGLVTVEGVAKPILQTNDDVAIKVVHVCVCGSNLWSYASGDEKAAHSENSDHEALGVVEEVGSAITAMRLGSLIIMPSAHGRGECNACRAGFDGTCDNHPGYTSRPSDFQSEYIRFHRANWALVKIPGQPSNYSGGMMKSLLTLADIMPTGYHAACVVDVKRGDKVTVAGDGAVEQYAITAVRIRGVSQIVLTSRHEDRQQMAFASGATAIVTERGEGNTAKVCQIFGGGTSAALECVGTETAIEQALGIIHNSGRVRFVGVPHYNNRPLGPTSVQNITIGDGSASVITYDKQPLPKAILDGDISPGHILTNIYRLDDINQAYKDIQDRKAIKPMIIMD